MLKLRNVKKSFGRDEFSLFIDELNIERGEFFGLLGPSGCGKTTLLKLMSGLIEPDGGEIIKNCDNMTMVFQQPLLFPHLTVEKNVEFGLKMKKIESSKRKKLIDKYLEVVGLLDFKKRLPTELSGGQMQRVSIARAMVTEPEILLMDEPFSALDPGLREDMRRLISEIHKTSGITVVFVTHDIDEAFELFSRTLVLKDGREIDLGAPYDIYLKSRNIDSAKFLNPSNILDLSDDFLSTRPFDARYRHAVLRPEAVKIRKSSDTYREGLIYKRGKIENIRRSVGLTHFFIKLEDTALEVTDTLSIEKDFSIGEEVEVYFSIEDIHFLE